MGGWSGEGCVLQVAADAVCSVVVVVVWTLLGGIPALLVPSLAHALSPLPLSSHPHLWKDQRQDQLNIYYSFNAKNQQEMYMML